MLHMTRRGFVLIGFSLLAACLQPHDPDDCSWLCRTAAAAAASVCYLATWTVMPSSQHLSHNALLPYLLPRLCIGCLGWWPVVQRPASQQQQQRKLSVPVSSVLAAALIRFTQ